MLAVHQQHAVRVGVRIDEPRGDGVPGRVYDAARLSGGQVPQRLDPLAGYADVRTVSGLPGTVYNRPADYQHVKHVNSPKWPAYGLPYFVGETSILKKSFAPAVILAYPTSITSSRPITSEMRGSVTIEPDEMWRTTSSTSLWR